MKACILGGGTWGSALSVVLADTGHDVSIWDRQPNIVNAINRKRKAEWLQDVEYPAAVTATSDVGQALDGAKVVVSAISSVGLPDVTGAIGPMIPPDAILVSGTKGLHPDTLKRPSEAWLAANPSLDGRIVAISGPNFAIEIARRLPSATVVASKSDEAAKFAQSAFMTPYLRVYTNFDIAGVELGGSLKNVIALACGMAEGLGIGYNAQAAVISRGIAEMTRLGAALGAGPLTFAGLSGLGDLVLTSTGYLSRNRQAGIAVGRGEALDDFIVRTGYTVEGAVTVKGAVKLAKEHRVAMPIADVVNRILYMGVPVRQGLYEIMSRDRKSEFE